MNVITKRNYTRNLTCMMFSGVLLSWCLFLAGFAVADDDPLTQLQASVDSIIAVLQDEKLAVPEMREERRRKVEAQVDTLFDFQEMGKRTLGAAWDKATAEERKEFVDLFASMVKERYIGKIDEYSGQKVTFKKQVVKEKSAIVYSILLNNGVEIPMDYKMLRKGAKWVGYDMRIENVSLVANYRRDFQGILQKDKFSGLLQKMREKVDKIQSTS
jgi:phospholipid transport system substrate-binding protein